MSMMQTPYDPEYTELAAFEAKKKTVALEALLNSAYSAIETLNDEVAQLKADLARETARGLELESITSWKHQTSTSGITYLPFVEEHYWYEPERGPVIFAGEANLLEEQYMKALDKLATVEQTVFQLLAMESLHNASN